MAEKKVKRYVSDNAQLLAAWDWERNNQLELDPYCITCGSNKNAWWKCNNGHRWEAKINNRNNGNGCPYCSGKKVLRGTNDLRTVNPTLEKEWDYERNCGLKPEDFTANSGKKYGGNVAKDTNGKQRYAIEITATDVRIVLAGSQLKGKPI